jgi:hypothetical protein
MEPAAPVANSDDAERRTVVRAARCARDKQRSRGQALQEDSAILFHTFRIVSAFALPGGTFWASFVGFAIHLAVAIRAR